MLLEHDPEKPVSTFPDHALGVVEKRHEAEVHMQLLVAMEQSQAGIVGHKVDFNFLISPQHDDVLQYAGGGLSSYPGQFKAMPMQMDRMYIVTGVAHA